MSEAHLVVAGVRICVSGESVMATGLASGRDFIIPSSVFFPSLSVTLSVTGIGHGAFTQTSINVVTIPRHVQILSSKCFYDCKSLSSVSFETDSELTRIESHAFWSCLSLRSITIPRHVQILCSDSFSECKSLSSISFETDSELTRIESHAFRSCSSLKSITIPQNVQFIDDLAFSNLSISIKSENSHFLVPSGLIRRLRTKKWNRELIVVPMLWFLAVLVFFVLCRLCLR
jgi:hypothetical protein